MRKTYLLIIATLFLPLTVLANPIKGMLERIDEGASKKFIIEVKKSPVDFFELDQKGKKVVVRGNSYVNVATGINWYLKYYAGIHLSWNGMKADLPEVLPPVTKKERRETDLSLRYDFNYCTYSYTMAFWDWERWEQEIDWMALHGINLPLAAIGQECVWRNMLLKFGYSKEEVNEFIAGPAFLAWWAMNNLEGWGGPNPDSWYERQEALQKKVLKRMKEFGIEPVLPGYSGMVPHNANKKMGLNITESEPWNGFTRPAILQPFDPRFEEMADVYYKEQEALFGKANYYSMDPFHESKMIGEIDYDAAGQIIMKTMKKVNPKAVWVVQAWDKNPQRDMIKNLKNGDMLILDLFSECRPQWGIPSLWKREEGFLHHDWAFCFLQNFGANVGLHGRMDQLLENFYMTKTHPLAKHMTGFGLTLEGSENNPVMFELMCERPWRPEKFTKEEWLKNYVIARYGVKDEKISIRKNTISAIVENYTRESGVRELKKKLGKIFRTIAYQRACFDEVRYPILKPEHLKEILGPQKYSRETYQGNDYAGVVVGLAWTAVGGEILYIETSLSRGKDSKITLTGNLGDVMKESAILALEYVKSHASQLGIPAFVFEKWNIHLHVPEGAIPKDGPSAGITMATAIASAFTQRRVRSNLAMSGEITLRGKVLPVGGIKEKILAAKRAGIKEIILCAENRRDIEVIPEEYVKGLEFHYVEDISEVLDIALLETKVNNPLNLTESEI